MIYLHVDLQNKNQHIVFTRHVILAFKVYVDDILSFEHFVIATKCYIVDRIKL